MPHRRTYAVTGNCDVCLPIFVTLSRCGLHGNGIIDGGYVLHSYTLHVSFRWQHRTQNFIQTTPRREYLGHEFLRYLMAADIKYDTLFYGHTQRVYVLKARALHSRKEGLVGHNAGTSTIHGSTDFFEHGHIVALTPQHGGNQQASQGTTDD